MAILAGCGGTHHNTGDGGTADHPVSGCGQEVGKPCCDDGTCADGLECLHTTCYTARKGDLGKECANDFDCSERMCRPVAFPQGSSVGQNACTYSCSSNNDCLPGWECLPLASGGGKVCQCSMGQYSADGSEACDGKDDNCNGYIDDEVADCTQVNYVCRDAQCVCKGDICGGVCLDTDVDLQNCGACNHACPVPEHGSAICTNGMCDANCAAGYDKTSCPGICVDPLLNCGSCGHACPVPDHSTAACTAGVCSYTCWGGYTDTGTACVSPQPYDPAAWSYPETTWVITSIHLPANSSEASSLAFDLDGNGSRDNQYYNLLAVMASYAPTPSQTVIDGAIAQGKAIHLVALFAQTLADSASANEWEFLGQPTPGVPPQAGHSYVIDTVNGLSDGFQHGQITSLFGTFGGPNGKAALIMPLLLAADASGVAVFKMRAVRSEFTISGDQQTMSGRIGGAVPENEFNGPILIAWAAMLEQSLTQHCAMSGGVCTCPSGSAAETIEASFDANADCHISTQELQDNNIVKAFLKGDVTLEDGSKGISLAVGFTAARATFSHPAPPQ